MSFLSATSKKECINASWLIGGKIFQMAISLYVGVISARYLGPNNYGLISYGNAYVAFFSALCTLGINSIIVKELLDNKEKQGEILGSALIMRFLSSMLCSFMIWGIVSILDRNEPTTILVVMLCSLGTVFSTFDTLNFWFQSRYESKVTSIATLLAHIITAGYKVILLIIGMDVVWFAIANSIDYMVIAAFLWFSYKKNGGYELSFSLKTGKNLIKNSYNYILSGLMVAIYVQTDKLMLKQYLNECEVGYYAIATSICLMWTFVLQAIIDSVYPTILTLKKENEASYRRKNRQLYAIVFYISALVSMIFILFSSNIVEVLYGDKYLQAAPILKFATLYTVFSFLGVARNAWIVSEGHQKYLKYIYFCAAILNVGLNSLFIPYLGGVGAALASFITQISTSMLLPLCIKDLRPNARLMIEAICLRKIV